jgi:hypothetical protein
MKKKYDSKTIAIIVTAAVLAADKRYCTVCTEIIATLGHLEIGGVRLGGQNSVTAELRGLFVTERGVLLSPHNRLTRLGYVTEAADTDYRVNLGHLAHNLLAIALNEAARRDNMTALAPLLEPLGIENILYRLLLRALYKAAGVDYYNFSLLLFGSYLKSRRVEIIKHHLGVHEIFGTTK